ncbi:hypothetical protein QBC45DRAFT_391958 [Copromyces sp. CBS 386.78]|nr:hypothetical protein QBC45DRAFT_391958 [Copromyces sp. CBS 386.78]
MLENQGKAKNKKEEDEEAKAAQASSSKDAPKITAGTCMDGRYGCGLRAFKEMQEHAEMLQNETKRGFGRCVRSGKLVKASLTFAESFLTAENGIEFHAYKYDEAQGWFKEMPNYRPQRRKYREGSGLEDFFREEW